MFKINSWYVFAVPLRILFMETLTPLIKFYDEFCVKRIVKWKSWGWWTKIKRDNHSSLGMLPLDSPNIYQISTRIQAWGCQATSLQPSWYQVSKPSYMAIKKALCGRQPGYFVCDFSLCPLAVTRDFVSSLGSGIFNKVPSFTLLVWKSCL